MPIVLCRHGWENWRGIKYFQTYSTTSIKRKLSSYVSFVCLVSEMFQAMVCHGRVELLAHPLSQKYLQMKWNSYGKYFHLANVLFYSIFLTFVTCFSSHLMAHESKEDFYVHSPEEYLNHVQLNKTANLSHEVRLNLECAFCTVNWYKCGVCNKYPFIAASKQNVWKGIKKLK